MAALCVGLAILFSVGAAGVLVLFAFFIPSVLLSRWRRARKSALVDVGKHGPRDAWQVLANGGVAALCAVASVRLGPAWIAAFCGALAAASADTWGTEIGAALGTQPRSILTLRPLAAGLSGGVTALGTLAEIGGSLVVALATLTVVAGLPVLIGGIAGALVDSLLGASVQTLRWCARCARACETNPHACGTPTTVRRGVSWLGNDAVNLACTVTGALVAGMLFAHVPILRW